MKNSRVHWPFRLIATLLVAILIVIDVPIGTFAAENSDPIVVVSLGDSFSSGEGNPPFYGQTGSDKLNDHDWLAHRSPLAWPALLEFPGISGKTGDYRIIQSNSPIQWYFVASSGAVTDDFTGSQLKPRNRDGYDENDNEGVPLPPQLDIFDSLEEGSVDYVTMTIGGNDVQFSKVIETVIAGSADLDFCLTGDSLDMLLSSLEDNMPSTIEKIYNTYGKVEDAAGEQAEIIVAGYPQLLHAHAPFISEAEAQKVNDKVTFFNGQLAETVKKCDEDEGMKIHFVDVDVEPGFNGRHQAYSDDPWINPVYFGWRSEDLRQNIKYTKASSYSIHPNEAGHQAYARCVNAEIERIEYLKKTGILSGKICKASDRTTPVTNAQIQAYSPLCTKNATPDSNGNYSMELPVNRYYVTVKAEGYIPFKAYAVVKENQTEYMQTFLMVEGEETDIGSAQGMITNALNGAGLGDVTLDVRKGWNNEDDGEILTTVTTDDYGAYLVTLPIGNYTLCASKEGFAPTMVNIIVQKTNSDNQDGTMSPILSGDDYRIVLTWGENPRDLDSHVVGTLTNDGSFHVYYNHKSQYDGDVEVCNLDLDDVDGEGPETITLHATTSNPYYYYINRYAGSGTVASSGAQIKVYQGEREIATFNVPTNLGDGDYWNVFAIVDGEFVIKNTISSDADLNYANASSRITTISVDVEADVVASPKEIVAFAEETTPSADEDLATDFTSDPSTP